MDTDWRRGGLVATALVLLANPLLVPHPTQPSYTYRATPLEVTDNGVRRQATGGGLVGEATDEKRVSLPGVDCQLSRWGARGGSYLCLYDLIALRRGSVNLSVDASVTTNIDGTPDEMDSLHEADLFVAGKRYTRMGGRYYERVYTPSNGTYRLKPVTTRRVLDGVSGRYQPVMSETDVADPLWRRVVNRGRVTVHGEYLGRAVVRKDGTTGTQYYLVWQSDDDPPLVPPVIDRRLVTAARWILFLVGAGLLSHATGGARG